MTTPKQNNPSECWMDGEREAFERRAVSEHWAIHRRGGAQYVNTATEHAWRGWQARAQSTPRDSGLLGELEELVIGWVGETQGERPSDYGRGWCDGQESSGYQLQNIIAKYRGRK